MALLLFVALIRVLLPGFLLLALRLGGLGLGEVAAGGLAGGELGQLGGGVFGLGAGFEQTEILLLHGGDAVLALGLLASAEESFLVGAALAFLDGAADFSGVSGAYRAAYFFLSSSCCFLERKNILKSALRSLEASSTAEYFCCPGFRKWLFRCDIGADTIDF